ncbi:hypothetical protein [Cyanobium sp. NIES-981]|uniref:hypothetical protein n=1 Tax=Cyanobium sp. NIES-981 TaxID=1851505 RepID=UPI0012FB044E|nr:hypothetical protein [Cyanobium sp. NIES-981]
MYDPSGFPGGNIILDFMRLLGLENPTLPSPPSGYRNKSWGWKAVEFSKYIAFSYWERLRKDPPFKRSMFNALISTVNSTCLASKSDWLGKAPVYLDEQEQENLYLYYERDNMVLKERYLPEFNVTRSAEPVHWISTSTYDIPPEEFNACLNTFVDNLPPSLRQELF